MTFLLAALLLAADPWFTRGTIAMTAGQTTFDANVHGASFAGNGQGGQLGVDHYGRHLGFDLVLAGSQAALPGGPADTAVIPSRAEAGEVDAAFTGALLNSHGLFLAIGPAVEARATMAGTFEQGNALATSWQTVVGGGALHTRVFAGPHVYFTGHGYYGAVPLSGHWQTVDAAQAAASTTGTPLLAGNVKDPSVVSGSLAASVRPVEWLALSGGIAARDATFSLDDGTHSHEHSVRPFLGLELLY